MKTKDATPRPKLIALDGVTINFLQNLRSTRKKLGLTIDKVSEAIGIGSSSIITYEKGYGCPTLLILMKLADFLHYDISGSLNYKYYHRQIKPDKIKREMKLYGLSLREIARISRRSRGSIIQAAKVKENASLPALLAIFNVIEHEKHAYALRQHITRMNGGGKR